MITPSSVILACCILAVSVCGIVILRRTVRHEREDRERLLGRPSSYHVEDYKADKRCDICFDSMAGEKVCDCACGKTFHRSCAEPTGSCPYCGLEFERFPVKEREAKVLRCFRCGSAVGQNVCECGTVIPYRDGSFSCPCGEVLNQEDGWCPNCGRRYERRTAVVDKTLLPDR